MIKKTITYTDYNGNQKTKDLYFNLTKTELYKMNFSEKGGFENYVKKLWNEEDGKEIIHVFDEILRMSYGEKSADGEYFVKYAPDGHRLGDDFAQTTAYDILFLELATDQVKGAEFINGVVPEELSNKTEKIVNDSTKVVSMNNVPIDNN